MIALDTSVVVAALAEWHESHLEARVTARGASVPAHVVVETYSVLTRLPHPHRFAPEIAGRLLDGWFPARRVLVPSRQLVGSLVARLVRAGIEAGASYDALVALTSQAHGCELVTSDRRASVTYERLGVAFRILGR